MEQREHCLIDTEREGSCVIYSLHKKFCDKGSLLEGGCKTFITYSLCDRCAHVKLMKAENVSLCPQAAPLTRRFCKMQCEEIQTVATLFNTAYMSIKCDFKLQRIWQTLSLASKNDLKLASNYIKYPQSERLYSSNCKVSEVATAQMHTHSYVW